MSLSLALDFFPLLAAVLAALSCGLLGNYLVLRRQSLMGDAISHSVLPGLVLAFLWTSSRSSWAMFAGAALAGLVTVLLVELIKRLGRVEAGAAMGVVFSLLFASGVLLIETAELRHVDLDADCVLHGQLETLVWFDAPKDWLAVFSSSAIEAAPPAIGTLSLITLLAFTFVGLLFKELRIVSFDPALARTLGIPATLVQGLLMLLVAAATVAAFEAVGSILVIAMLICPAATARFWTDRLTRQLTISLLFALLASCGGYIAATALPAAMGWDSVHAAGSMAVAAGLLLFLSAILAPQYGWLARQAHRRRTKTTGTTPS